jgi:cysteine desulfurase family protein
VIYFDSGATTLEKPKAVARATARAMHRYASPGRGGYDAAMEAAEAVYACRVEAAQLFETEPERVVFTMNATHGLNIAIRSLVRPGDRVVVSGFEHNSVMRPLTELGAEVVIAGRTLFDPHDTLREFTRLVTAGTRAVICTHVSNVFGYVLPVAEIAELCGRRGVPFVLDASQSAGMLSVSMAALRPAFIAMPGHKGLYGPQGTGLLLCGDGPVEPLLAGGTGSQSRLLQMPRELPDRLEAGTHNVPGICGLLEGLRFVRQEGVDHILRHELELMDDLRERLAAIPNLRMFASDQGNQTGVLSVLVEGQDCEETAQELARRGIAVRAGLHCAPIAHESAGTLQTGTVRISCSAFNSHREVRALARALAEIAKND